MNLRFRRPATGSDSTLAVPDFGFGRDIRKVGGSAIVIAAVPGVAIVVPALVPILLLGLAAWTFRGYRQVIQSLTLAWLLTFLSPVLYEGQAGLQWLVILAAVLSVLYRLGPSRSGRVMQASGLGVAALLFLPSVLFSSAFELAALKLVSFVAGAFVVLAVLVVAPLVDRDWLSGWFVGLFWFVILASLPLVGSGLGYSRNGYAFQGILNQPQTLGVFLAPYIAVFALDWIARGRLPFAGLGALAGIVLLPMTDARVGVIAAVGGVAVAAGASWLGHRGDSLVDRSRVLLAGTTVLSILILAMTLGYATAAHDFAAKGRSDSILESFEVSRGGLVRESIDRFVESPVIGWGLGIPAEIDEAVITRLAGFPVSAPVEAGFALTGILEQTGVLGLIGLLVLVLKSIWPTIRSGPLAASGLAAAALLTNLGEATITSFGGLGLFVWLMIGWAVVLSRESSGTADLAPR